MNFYKEIDKTLPVISISEILNMLNEPFDKEGVATKTHDKYFNDESSQYYQKSVQEICEMWEAKGAESCRYGSLLDNYIGYNLTGTEDDLELWKLDNNYDYDERLKNHCTAFDNFYELVKKSGDTEFVDREKTIYYNAGDFYVKGRFDALFKNTKTNRYIIVDWKSSGTIDKVPNRWTKKLLGPAANLPALNYFTYTIQLYFYKKALIESGYLPEGTTPDDVEVLIVNLPNHLIEDTGRTFETHMPAFQYDSEYLNKIFDFGFKKKRLLDKKHSM